MSNFGRVILDPTIYSKTNYGAEQTGTGAQAAMSRGGQVKVAGRAPTSKARRWSSSCQLRLALACCSCLASFSGQLSSMDLIFSLKLKLAFKDSNLS